MVAGTEDKNANNVIFTIKHTKLYDPLVTLSAKDKKKYQYILAKGLKDSLLQQI